MTNRTSLVNIKYDKDYDVYIGRGSKWGNPFIIGKNGTREEVIILYEKWLLKNELLILDLKELRGKKLGCFCYPSPCHGDVLIKLIEDYI